MATLQKAIRWRKAGGGNFQVEIYPEAATGVFKFGEFVNLSSGKVQRITTTATGNITSTDGVLGVALKNASGTTDDDVPVLIADENVEFRLPVTHATPATGVTAITNIGTGYCLSHLSTGGWYAYEISQTSNPIFEVVAIAPDYPVGEQHGWAWGRIIDNAKVIA